MERRCSELCFGAEKIQKTANKPLEKWFNYRNLGEIVVGAFLAEVTLVSLFRLFYNPDQHTARML